MNTTNDVNLKGMLFNDNTVKKWYHNDVLVFSAGNMVTYCVDQKDVFVKEVESGSSALAFTPTKTGYTFVGWREDNTASSDVLAEKTMDSDPFTLYAVFKKTVTLSYDGNGSTDGSMTSQDGTQYYNNGNTADPSFVLKSNGFTRMQYTFSRWAGGSPSGEKYNVGDSITIAENTTMYALWFESVLTINYTNSVTYPYVGTGGDTSSDDGWNGDVGYLGSGLVLNDLAKGYINKPIDFTNYKKLTVNLKGVWFNHTGTLKFGVGFSVENNVFEKSTDVTYPEANSTLSATLDISGVTGNGYIKFSNLSEKTCGIVSLEVSV